MKKAAKDYLDWLAALRKEDRRKEGLKPRGCGQQNICLAYERKLCKGAYYLDTELGMYFAVNSCDIPGKDFVCGFTESLTCQYRQKELLEKLTNGGRK